MHDFCTFFYKDLEAMYSRLNGSSKDSRYNHSEVFVFSHSVYDLVIYHGNYRQLILGVNILLWNDWTLQVGLFQKLVNGVWPFFLTSL